MEENNKLSLPIIFLSIGSIFVSLIYDIDLSISFFVNSLFKLSLSNRPLRHILKFYVYQ